MKPRNSFVRFPWEPACSEGRPNFVDFAPVSSQKADNGGRAVSIHLNTYKYTVYKYLYFWIFPLSYLASTYLASCTLYSRFPWNFVKIIRNKTRDIYDFLGLYIVFSNGLIHNITNRKPASIGINITVYKPRYFTTDSVGRWLACIAKNEKALDCVRIL